MHLDTCPFNYARVDIYAKSRCNLIIVIQRVYPAITQSNYVRR